LKNGEKLKNFSKGSHFDRNAMRYLFTIGVIEKKPLNQNIFTFFSK